LLPVSKKFANSISSRLRFEFFEFAISDFSISDFEKSVAIEPRSRRINRDAAYTDPHFFAAPLSDRASVSYYGSFPELEKELIHRASRRDLNDEKHDEQYAEQSDHIAEKSCDELMLRHDRLHCHRTI